MVSCLIVANVLCHEKNTKFCSFGYGSPSLSSNPEIENKPKINHHKPVKNIQIQIEILVFWSSYRFDVFGYKNMIINVIIVANKLPIYP